MKVVSMRVAWDNTLTKGTQTQEVRKPHSCPEYSGGNCHGRLTYKLSQRHLQSCTKELLQGHLLSNCLFNQTDRMPIICIVILQSKKCHYSLENLSMICWFLQIDRYMHQIFMEFPQNVKCMHYAESKTKSLAQARLLLNSCNSEMLCI